VLPERPALVFSGIMAAAACASRQQWLALSAASEDLDNPADRLRAIEARAGTPDNFDAVNSLRRQVLEGRSARA